MNLTLSLLLLVAAIVLAVIALLLAAGSLNGDWQPWFLGSWLAFLVAKVAP